MKKDSLYSVILVVCAVLTIVIIISVSIVITKVHELELRINNTEHDVILLIKQLEDLEINNIN